MQVFASRGYRIPASDPAGRIPGILRTGSLAEEKGSRNCKRKAEILSSTFIETNGNGASGDEPANKRQKLTQEAVYRHNNERDHDDDVFVRYYHGCTCLTSPMQRCQCFSPRGAVQADGITPYATSSECKLSALHQSSHETTSSPSAVESQTESQRENEYYTDAAIMFEIMKSLDGLDDAICRYRELNSDEAAAEQRQHKDKAVDRSLIYGKDIIA
ncbi:hypothetical protein JB92DRAFT_2199680 [Gautieria morchelliformis]|nr:hypothetical protein JB92DRAFT_2199680 [Gautieria morchelliformis]